MCCTHCVCRFACHHQQMEVAQACCVGRARIGAHFAAAAAVVEVVEVVGVVGVVAVVGFVGGVGVRRWSGGWG